MILRIGVAISEKIDVIRGFEETDTIIIFQERRDTTLHAAILSQATDIDVISTKYYSLKRTSCREETEYLPSSALLKNEAK
ncbi:MAG: hypothetical protein ACSLEL_00165 [Candidatus Malihini olakiniferum]